MSPKKLANKVKMLEASLKRLKPASAPGVLTNVTSHGVTRRPTSTSTASTGSSDSCVPRWG